LPIHPGFEGQRGAHDEAHDKAHDVLLNETEQRILTSCAAGPIRPLGIRQNLGSRTLSGGAKKAIRHLLEIGALVHTIPDRLRSKNQQYKITDKGRVLLVAKK
jgi:hypothetical protein